MKRRLLLSLATSLLGILPIQAAKPDPLQTLVDQVAAGDPAKAEAAIQGLRAAGPTGLQALSATYAPSVASFQHGMLEASRSGIEPKWWRIKTAFDRVGAQRDNYLSQLYWFTDLPAAEAAAKAAGKPILSLRLLGQLDEDYSCANSRFFRTTLYPNAEVSRYLRDHFILHWQTERPVPRITIEMGDGRKIERTITGNSIHYILDAEGRPIDALPGLYSAKAFIAGLQRAEKAELAARQAGASRSQMLQDYHRDEAARIKAQWTQDLARITLSQMGIVPLDNKTDAIGASFRTASKTGVEAPMLRMVVANNPAGDRTRLEAQSSVEVWKKLADLHALDATLDAPTRALIAEKQEPGLAAAMNSTISKRLVETPMSRMLHSLTHSIAEDTVRNEYEMHSQLHEWLAQDPTPPLPALNSRVYAELFLTPESDPWLGLAPADTFSALDRRGLVQPPPGVK